MTEEKTSESKRTGLVSEKKQEKKGEEHKEKRIIAVPGETIVSGSDFLPGDGTRREGNNIIANRFGLTDESGRLVRIIPLSGVYNPRKRNIVIGKVIDVTFNGWIIDINAPYDAFLSLMECPKYINKEDITQYIDLGDMVCAMVFSIKRRGVDLTIKGRGLGKLEDGMIIYINSNKVPRVIGKEGSMISLIKNETNCNITVGQNGVVWISGKNIDNELFAKEAILFVTEKSYIGGLTEKMKEWFEKNKKDEKTENKEAEE